MSRTLKILLADDHSILRTGLKLLLSTQKDFKVVAEASNGKEVLSLLDDGLEVDVILLDLSMSVMSGLKESLSSREEEVLNYIVRGYSLSDIAQKLCLSVKTISTYKTRIMTKLNCKQNSDLVNYALKNNILDKY